MTESAPPQSPRWSAITKLVISLTVVVILGALLLRFKGLIAPILMAFVIAYLLHPLVNFLATRARLSWKLSVNLVYLAILLLLGGLLTLSGVGIVTQVQNLIRFIRNNIDAIPTFFETIASEVYSFGPLTIDMSEIISENDWGPIGDQVLSYVDPALGQLGGLVATIAGGAASVFGWTVFIFIVSYFFLFESGGLRERIIQIEIPVYAQDLRRMSRELSQIWNAFLRGQIIIFFLTSAVYAAVLSALGVRFAVVLALITGFANFLPYVGPAINWVVLGLVTYLQPANIFGLTPFGFTLVVIITAIVIDQIFNNLIIPRILATALRVHPAFVLIAALLAANLFGVIGVILAAPLLATLQLLGQYITRKMLDRDPWPEEEQAPPPPPGSRVFERVRAWWQARAGKRGASRRKGPRQKPPANEPKGKNGPRKQKPAA
ncbi:MAG: AI-2E family transporter [Anaerolineales bacterium]|nr:AI-2E family transporter [Anaerolineales bacterium]